MINGGLSVHLSYPASDTPVPSRIFIFHLATPKKKRPCPYFHNSYLLQVATSYWSLTVLLLLCPALPILPFYSLGP
ncbi:uncharacterized protein K452DRAFT_138383 [Aplosporella prunicola CBS 121167]|uniref:Uncharacterized protein n=1 Tax=Aplosporella prunicola CBS 121167 TaxID=1176127 RepID=A0A6A6B0Q1_9PEZI|nr:uncharacterized protein K452DRAFT_138383 [Aplosporella prunicola CBS 121167]KAF2136301.1 hypothetical protein K452DRAFT_138383 [Aplosporella prunicola CBS 121167]